MKASERPPSRLRHEIERHSSKSRGRCKTIDFKRETSGTCRTQFVHIREKNSAALFLVTRHSTLRIQLPAFCPIKFSPSRGVLVVVVLHGDYFVLQVATHQKHVPGIEAVGTQAFIAGAGVTRVHRYTPPPQP